MPLAPVSLRALNRATLARQMLLARERVSAAAALERLFALQAQEARPPFVSLWSRVAGFRREDLTNAYSARDVVRATTMRATLHAMTAPTFAAMRGALQPALAAALRVLGERATGLDVPAVLPVARRLLAERPRTFEELRPALAAEFPGVDQRALGYATRMHLPLVLVPTDEPWGFPAAAAFALADEWLAEPITADAAPENLVLRYLSAFGPATVADAQEWTGVQGLRASFESLRPRLVSFRDERGRELFDLPGAPRPDPESRAPARYLPDFDSLVLAHADRRRLIADHHRPRMATKNLRVPAVFLWDGMIHGLWRAERKLQAIILHLTPFEPLPEDAVAELSEEGEHLARFLEPEASSVEVRLSPS